MIQFLSSADKIQMIQYQESTKYRSLRTKRVQSTDDSVPGKFIVKRIQYHNSTKYRIFSTKRVWNRIYQVQSSVDSVPIKYRVHRIQYKESQSTDDSVPG